MSHRKHHDPEPKHKLNLPPGYSAAELHSHTVASDGMVTAVQLVEAAAEIGLSVIAITDHDVIGDLSAAVARGKELGVDVVRGEEVTTKWRLFHEEPAAHIIGLFLDRPIRMGMSVVDTVDAIHDNGGLAVIAHPSMALFFASMNRSSLRRLLDKRHIDGIELRHTAPVWPGTWKRLDDFFAEHRHQIGASVGAGDSHFGIKDLGRVVTIFPGKGADDLRKAIENGTTSWAVGVEGSHKGLGSWFGQQKRALVWLNNERRHGRVGRGAGPHHPRHHRARGGQELGGS